MQSMVDMRHARAERGDLLAFSLKMKSQSESEIIYCMSSQDNVCARTDTVMLPRIVIVSAAASPL